MSLRKLFFAVLSVAGIVASALMPTAHAQVRDSTNVLGAGALPLSNCTNISGAWYAAGQVPAGYYKQTASPYYCKPIPACAGNQVFSTSSETCGCPAGTTWDASYGTCHAACSAGTAWNGSSCASICSGGQTWNGSTCACPAGQVWNGTTCGAVPVISGFSMSPATQTVGSNYTLAWNVSGASSLGLTCTGATSMTGSLSPLTSGSGTIAASAPGTTTCTVKATNAYGSSTAADSSTASCAAGTTWNGSSCVSSCTGGQTWNGSTCTCPAGQVWNGSSCGYAPAFSTFSVTPSSVNVGSNYAVSWGIASTSSTPVTVTMKCTGATAASYTLSPSSGGSGTLTAAAPGNTSCTSTASSSWGTATASSGTLTAACPAGTIWDSSSLTCKVLAITSGSIGVSGASTWKVGLLSSGGKPASASFSFTMQTDGTWSLLVSGTGNGKVSYTPSGAALTGLWAPSQTAGIGSSWKVMFVFDDSGDYSDGISAVTHTNPAKTYTTIGTALTAKVVASADGHTAASDAGSASISGNFSVYVMKISTGQTQLLGTISYDLQADGT